MIRVGVTTTKAQGWLKTNAATEWPQAITMVFTDQMGRQPVLFFKDHQALEELCSADSIKDTIEQYVTLFRKNVKLPSDCPVIASEPFDEEGQVSQKDFYLLPVINIDRQFSDSGTQLLEVACLDPGIADTKKDEKAMVEEKNTSAIGMRTGIVFVVDTTKSMRPYIEQTKEIIRNVFDRMQSSPAKDKIAFAVIAFRSRPELGPGTEYNAKVVSDFTTVSERAKLEDLLSGLEETKASTHTFDEDSLAGVKMAVDSLQWDMVDGKIILLVTDAGPLSGPQDKRLADTKKDRSSTTGMTSESMADYLRTNGIFLTALHVKTPQGKNDHPYAEKSYRELARLSNGRSSYLAIEAKTTAEGEARFRSVGKTIADIFCKIAENQIRGAQASRPKIQDERKELSAEDQARQIAEACGYAMQLRFVGDRKKTTAPHVVKAWIADSDLTSLEEHPDNAPLPAVEAAVLLTKTQLSQLRMQLDTIINTAEKAFLQDSENFNFYEQLISAAAQMSRDPSSFSNAPNANLAQKGVLLEVLDGLPYKSRVLGFQQEDWTNMTTGDKEQFIKRLKGLVREYEEFDRDNTHWEGFGGTEANDLSFRVPLRSLP